MNYPSIPATAQELMVKWQNEHNTNERVLIDNRHWINEESRTHYFSFFPDALELLCHAIERGSFHKPIHVNVRRRTAIRAVLEGVQEKRLLNVVLLALSKDYSEVDEYYQQEIHILTKCIENGSLGKLECFDLCCNNSVSDNGAVLSAVATGKAPNLVSIRFHGYCDEPTQEAVAQAIVDRKLPKLKNFLVGYGSNLFPLQDHLEMLRVPEEFADKENEDILAFLHERWEYGEVQLATAKVIVTGPTTVGKTCLVNCLKGNEFVPDPGSTNTMEIGKKTEDGGLVLFYHDFGGQKVYATSQGLFLQTPAAVFVVAWDRQEETGGDSARDQYARDVLDANPNAKLIFVTTKGDLKGHRPLSVAEEAELKAKYGDSFRGYYDVSAKGNKGVAELLDAIKSAAGVSDILMPKTYDDLLTSLMNLRENSVKWYVTRQEWGELCETVGIKGGDRINLALRIFLDMGEVVALSSGHVVVTPTVLVDVLSKVVTADIVHKENTRGGYLRHDELEDIWRTYPKELHVGFLNLIHNCGIGFPIRDEKQPCKATLIPAMMSESSGDEIYRGLEHLLTDFPGFKAGPQISLELSNISNQLWSKLLVKLHALVLFGAWWSNGYIIIDVDNTGGSRIVKSFGTVLLDADKHQIIIMAYGRSPSSVQLLRRRALGAVEMTAGGFPGVSLQRLQITSSSDVSWLEEWEEEALFRMPLDMRRFEKHGAPDVAEWVLKLKELRQINSGEQIEEEKSSFGYFMEMLQEGSGASDEVLCYLMLVHQDEMLKMGCGHGRLDLSALWLIYDHNGSRMAYPFCPHLHPRKVRVSKDLGVSGVSDVDLNILTEDQTAIKAVVIQIMERLRIRPPQYKADFLGILWHNSDEEYVFTVQEITTSCFQPVHVDDFEVFVHGSDQAYFINPTQEKAIKELTEKAKHSIFDMRTVAALPSRLDARRSQSKVTHFSHIQESVPNVNEAWLFGDDPYYWLCERFRDGKRRKEYMRPVLDETPISSNIANAVKSKTRNRVKAEFPDFHSFYPKVIISYSTGYREDYDHVECAGPGLMVVVAVINFLFDNGYPCYSDILTPAGRDWGEYMLRLDEAVVMVVLVCRKFLHSVNCLLEVSEAVDHGVELIPVRCEETSANGIDILRDKEAMWPDEELEKYAKLQKNTRSCLDKLKLQRRNAVKELSGVGSLPEYGTIISEPTSTDELANRVGDLLRVHSVDNAGGALCKKRKLGIYKAR